jgi:hypothetical protein
LEKEPLQQVETIYSRLRLPGFDAVESSLGTYIKSLHDYEKNKYALGPDAVAKVNRSWQFAFEEWGYDRI